MVARCAMATAARRCREIVDGGLTDMGGGSWPPRGLIGRGSGGVVHQGDAFVTVTTGEAGQPRPPRVAGGMVGSGVVHRCDRGVTG